MEAYLEELFTHLIPLQVLHDECYDIGDVVVKLFDDQVETVYFYKEDDYQGTACAVYKYKDKYCYVQESFGSCNGCDPWIDALIDEQQWMVGRMKEQVKDTLADHIYEVTYPFQNEYMDVRLKDGWRAVLETHPGAYEKCVDLANKRVLEELQVTQEIFEAQKKAAKEKEEQKRVQMLVKINEEREEAILTMKETIEYIRNGRSDEFYSSKISAKRRLLKYCLDKLPDSVMQQRGLEDLKQTASDILALKD